MSMCDGKLKINLDGTVENLPYRSFGVGEFNNSSRNQELGSDNQSLTDIFLSKLLEGIIGEAEVIKSGENIRIEYTDKNKFWVTITKIDDEYILSADEPAA